jgi:NitT/TauT family transport system ATP-binding protein
LNHLPTAIQITGAAKTYPSGTQALLPINLEIKGGEFVTLLGPSGCGKSTLLKMIASLIQPSSGKIDKPILQNSDTRMSFVFQSPTLMPWANVQTNVQLPLDISRIPKEESKNRVTKVLKTVGLEDFASEIPKNLSGGMQMRVSIARALVTKPALLLMDEPFGALDEITRHKLDSELLQLWSENALTILFVTHSIHEAVFLSSRVIMMAARPGRIIEEIKINEPYPRNPEFMMSSSFMNYALSIQKSLVIASDLDKF